jgi:squalene-hopene/tetraprenyl-beta-curcumene cyclase
MITKDLVIAYAPPVNSLAQSARMAAEKTAAYLLHDQQPDGRWIGTLSSSCEPTALAAIALYLVDKEQYAQRIKQGIAWLLQTQHPDGGWGDAIHDPSNTKATVLAVSALHLTSKVEHKAAIERGMSMLEKLGGWGAVSNVCAPIAALVGLIPWSQTKCLPYELILAPYGLRRRTSFGLPAFLSMGIMQNSHRFSPVWQRPLRVLARPNVVNWLRQVQAPNGSFEESVMMNSFVVIGLTAGGIAEASDIVQSSVHYTLNQQREDGSWPLDRDLEVSSTDTAIIALGGLGYDLRQPRFQRAKEWLLANQIREPFFATGAPGGGWAWAMPGGWPDIDDTSYALIGLAAFGLDSQHPQMQECTTWLLAMQNKNGSWSTFVKNSNMPFDQPCPYVTAHVLSGLWATGLFTANSKPVQRAIDWLQSVQRPDGSFPAIWFRNYSCATALVLEAMAEYSLVKTPLARQCLDWLLANQNLGGSWGGYREQPGTAEETSWAISALLLAGLSPTDKSIERGIGWLIDNQQPDGTWEPAIIGLYSQSLWYSNSSYAITFPLKALALYLRQVEAK